MFFDYNCIIIRLEQVDMLSFLHWYWTDFSDLNYEMDTCFLHLMLHVNFDLKKDFIDIRISFDLINILK